MTFIYIPYLICTTGFQHTCPQIPKYNRLEMFLTTMSWALNDMELYLVVISNMAVAALIII
jgi:hypothetical protein